MKHVVALSSHYGRARAMDLIAKAPDGWIAEVRQPARSTDQNAKMWAMLSDISVAKPEGRTLTPDLWKAVFMQACGHDVQFIEGLDGMPFPIGFRSSKLSRSQMADLITFIQAKGDEWGVRWTDTGENRER